MSNLVKATTNFKLTEFKHVNSVLEKLHRPDLLEVWLKVKGGTGAQGYEKKNGIGGAGGDITLMVSDQPRYNLNQMIDHLHKRVKIGKSFSTSYRGQALIDNDHNGMYDQKNIIYQEDLSRPPIISLKGKPGSDATQLKNLGVKGPNLCLEIPEMTAVYKLDVATERIKSLDNTKRTLYHEINREPFQTFHKFLNIKRQHLIAEGAQGGNFYNGYKNQYSNYHWFSLVRQQSAEICIVGHSNSGKTTLLQQLTGRRMGSIVSSGLNTTKGVQSGVVTFGDGIYARIYDTAPFDQLSQVEIDHRVLNAKSILLLVDPFGYQPNIETPKMSAFESILNFQLQLAARAKNYNFQRDVKILLVFNKIDIPGAKEKMQECMEQINYYPGELIKFSRVLAISANERYGLDKISNFARMVHDQHYEFNTLGREHRSLVGMGRKWPPPSLKDKNSPILTEIPREIIVQNNINRISPWTGGGNMLLNQIKAGKKPTGPVQAFAAFVEQKNQNKIRENEIHLKTMEKIKILPISEGGSIRQNIGKKAKKKFLDKAASEYLKSGEIDDTKFIFEDKLSKLGINEGDNINPCVESRKEKFQKFIDHEKKVWSVFKSSHPDLLKHKYQLDAHKLKEIKFLEEYNKTADKLVIASKQPESDD